MKLSAQRNSEGKVEINYREDIQAALDRFLIGIPGVKGGKAFGYPAYKVNGKIFCFVGGTGVSIKLERVMHFLDSVFPYSPHPKPLSLRERGLKTQEFCFSPLLPEGEGAGDEG
jgi:hypothetical protein